MRHYSNAWKFLLIFENLKLRLSERYHFAYATASPFQIFQIVTRGKKGFSFPLGLVWSEIRVRQAVKPSDCLYFVSICPRGSVSRHFFCRAYELPSLLHTAMAYWISHSNSLSSHLMLVSLTLLLLSFPPLRNRRSVKRIKISRNRDKTR